MVSSRSSAGAPSAAGSGGRRCACLSGSDVTSVPGDDRQFREAAKDGVELLQRLCLAGRARHLWTRQNICLPIPRLGLKDVGEYFGVARESGVTSGIAAEDMWRRYQLSGDQELKAELVSYNLDDLESLVHATEYLREHAAARMPETAAVHPVLHTAVTEHEPGGAPPWRPELALDRHRPPIRRAAVRPPSQRIRHRARQRLWTWPWIRGTHFGRGRR